MDTLAKAFLTQVIEHRLKFGNIKFKLEGWSLLYKNEKISRLNIASLYDDLKSTSSIQYWTDKGNLTPIISNSVDWDVLGEAMKRVPQSRRQWVSKHSSGFCAVGKMQQRIGKQNHEHCPLCGETEDAAHVFSCQDPRALKHWQTGVTLLNSWMVDKETAPGLCAAITQNLCCWKQGCPPNYTVLSTKLRAAMKSQTKIGWNHLLLGRLTKTWSILQDEHYKSLGSKKTGRTWAIGLTTQLWQLS
jgi:hypothetical protein